MEEGTGFYRGMGRENAPLSRSTETGNPKERVEGGTKPAPQGLRQRHHSLVLVRGTRARAKGLSGQVVHFGLCMLQSEPKEPREPERKIDEEKWPFGCHSIRSCNPADGDPYALMSTIIL